MRVLIHAASDLGALPIAGTRAEDRLLQALAALSPTEIVKVTEDRPIFERTHGKEMLWIEGWFPLLSAETLSDWVQRAREHERVLVGSVDDRAEFGILYRAGGESHCIGKTFDEVVANSDDCLVRMRDERAAMVLGDPGDWGKLNEIAYFVKAQRCSREGVLIQAPGMCWIDQTVAIEPGVEIGPNVALRGETRIAQGARIGMGAVLTNVIVGAGAEIKPYSVLEDCQVGEQAGVGPFAHIRPGSVLGPETRVGNFVETKKAVLGKGSKASHLSYLGDMEVGEDCNIGAGTITCNYDGFNKWRTVLGDGVFIGSDSQLVAPVQLGDGAYVAAGSTITKDVPADALAIGRGKQSIKEGRATLIRQRAWNKKEKGKTPS